MPKHLSSSRRVVRRVVLAPLEDADVLSLVRVARGRGALTPETVVLFTELRKQEVGFSAQLVRFDAFENSYPEEIAWRVEDMRSADLRFGGVEDEFGYEEEAEEQFDAERDAFLDELTEHANRLLEPRRAALLNSLKARPHPPARCGGRRPAARGRRTRRRASSSRAGPSDEPAEADLVHSEAGR